MTRAVVFAYHNVGVRCLQVLLSHGIDVQLVLTHTDNPTEQIWFDSVEDLAALNHLPCATPADPNTPEWLERIRALQPDFIFSFYYRHMLNMGLLGTARNGAYNMHGSLLPKYRGRVPVNWAIIQGERYTGATLHRMVAKPDAGEWVAQQAVPILPDDTALDVFRKVTVAAEIALDAALPRLLNGTATHTPLDLTQGSYFGGRKPEDGRVDWTQSAQQVHNLIRAVAAPFPGAFSVLQGKRLNILGSRIATSHPAQGGPALYIDAGKLFATCGDGRSVALQAEHAGKPLDAAAFLVLFGVTRIPA